MLTYRQLKAIQDGNSRNADILQLLREIKRLRGIVVEAYTFTGVIVLHNRTPEITTEHRRLREAMEAEPCVVEHVRMQETKRRIEYTRRAALQNDKLNRKATPD